MTEQYTTDESRASSRMISRWGFFIKVLPEPDENQVKDISAFMMGKRQWKRLEEKFIGGVLAKANILNKNIVSNLNDAPRIRFEENTRVVDYPSFRGKYEKDKVFDSRFCIGICAAGKATKIWTRVGFPFDDKYLHKPAECIPYNKLGSYITDYRNIARISSKLILDEFNEMIQDKFGQLKLVIDKEIEISAIGTKDQGLRKPFEMLLYTDSTPSGFFEDRKVEEICYSYLKFINPSLDPLRNVKDRYGNSFWLYSPVRVEIDNGYSEERRLIYFGKSERGTLQIIGIGYDDSRLGDMVHLSTRRIARWVSLKG